MKKYEDLTITDDFMFSKVMQDEELCKELIEILLDISIQKIEYFCKEKTIKEDQIGKGVRLDVYVKDSNRIFDIEIQTTNKHDLPQRSRYYQAMMDIDNLNAGNNFKNLKESYILFICTFDPFDIGLAKYVFRERSEEVDNLYLNDKTWKVFYNVNAYDTINDNRIKDFLQYLSTKQPMSEFTQKLEDAVYLAKGHQKWRKDYMTLAMKIDEYREDAIAEGMAKGMAQGMAQGISQGLAQGMAQGMAKGKTEGLQQGREETKLETAKNLLSLNLLTLEQIASSTGLTLEQVKELA